MSKQARDSQKKLVHPCIGLKARSTTTMANPRQRRKARSGKYSGATKSAKRAQNKRLKRAPTVMGPDILRENWDPTLTVRQKYVCMQADHAAMPSWV